ncbi:MAG: HYR domain-containing protein [Bacteroidetes bacterium]|nr:HYR domain-containing protein [Bacteroidota bacterium]
MSRFITFIFVLFLFGNTAFATIDISLSNPVSQTLLVSYKASSDYAAPPFNIWNSQVFTIRWGTDLGNGVITGIQNQSAFQFALDGTALDGGDGFFYQKFTAAATNVNQNIMANTPLPVLTISLFNGNICGGDFELVTGTPFVNSIFGTASINNVLGEQFNDFDPALVENVLLNPTSTLETWYSDTDNDGKGDPSVSVLDCEQPTGYVADQSDCDDSNPNLPTTPGTTCDDGNPNTVNDVILANGCDCAGTLVDCPALGLNIGDPCNDGDACTGNDLVQSDCTCAGTFQDADNDGTCDANDLCPGGPEPGSPCNDTDPTTVNDQINSNCQCVGTPTNCTGIGDADGDGVCTNMDCDDNDPQATSAIGSPCNDGDPCTINDQIQPGCGCAGTFQDSDNDGICDTDDICPNGPNPGTSCDDGDPNTTGETIQPDCNCGGGTPIYNCPALQANFGDTCDDGDPNTTGETIQNDCTCGGGTSGPNCPILNLNIGDQCDDNDNCTTNDVVQSDCTCAGTFEDSDNDGTCDYNDTCPGPEPGTPCNDGNPNTVNDMINSNCQCVGVVPSGGITLTCPPDIEVIVPTGTAGTNLNFTVPLASSSCNGGVGCIPTAIPGFTLMGEFGGSLYYLSTNSKQWDNARLDCIAKGGQLATIKSAAENQYIADHLGYGNAAYIGLSDKDSEGIFKWVDGTNLVYSNWNAGEPNNGNGFPENYTVMEGWTLGKWADYNIWVSKPYILEITCNPSGGTGNGLIGTQTSGPSSGGFFSVGQHEVAYSYTDNCGNQSTCSFNVNVIEESQPSGCAQLINLSLNGLASQSSDRFNAVASRAKDGNTSGNFWLDYSISHTEWEDNAWWQIDLGKKYDLKYVNIWNRTDCCQQYLSNFYVLVSDVPFTSTNLTSTLTQPGVSSYYQGGQVGIPTTISLEHSGRYVRVQLVGQAFLAMAEVQIFGCLGNNFSGGNGSNNLIYFGANGNANMNVDIQWLNRSQNGVHDYIIERSADGVSFEPIISTVEIDPAMDNKLYRDIDRNPFEGANIYRLKINYQDGSFEYSNRDTVLFQPDSDFIIFPNPASDEVRLYMKRFLGKEVDVIIANTLGEVIYTEHFAEVKDKILPIRLDRSKFVDGIYSVSVVRLGRAQSKRLVVARF